MSVDLAYPSLFVSLSYFSVSFIDDATFVGLSA